ncbi:unnamed protein product [Triticum turgidum subsp. durum]|uniref:Uncharacterized protein n=1 Tax=Triticum turgidum subsp. durum TaxID=4567 RepID=A0A9R1PNG7_TRITD|nr:unnamed protein product [Triticum turgidum subsp. durum]
MKSKSAKKAADEDEAKSKKIRSSRGKRRSVRHSRSRSPSPDGSSSSSPPRKRSKKPTKKIVDKRRKKSKGSGSRRRRRRSLSPSRSPSGSPSSVSRSHSRCSHHSISSSSASDSERSVSPLPKSHSKDPRKKKGRGRDKDRKRRRVRRSRSYSSSPARSGSSRSRSRSRSKSKSRKQRADGTRHYASRDRDVYSEEDAVADDYEKNVELKEMESPPSKDANETGEILPVSCESPEVEEDLELILRQKALENFRKFKGAVAMVGKTENNGTGKEVLADSPQNTVTKFPEARSARQQGLRTKMVLSLRRGLSLGCMMERQCRSAIKSTYQRQARDLQGGSCSAEGIEWTSI